MNSDLNRTSTHPHLVPVAVFGKDNRKFVSRKKTALTKKIGMLYNHRTRTLCTAFCIDKSVIGTAAHCLFGRAGRQRQKLRDFTFSLDHKSRRKTSRIEGARINAANQHVLTGSTHLRVRPPIDATRDWAIARLAKPVCKNGGFKISPLGVKEVIRESNKSNIFQVAFHRDLKKWRLAHSQSCKINRKFNKYRWPVISQDFIQSNKLILHRCDTGGASSGSPLLLKTKNGPTVVGINVGTYIQSKVLMRDGKITKRYKPQTVANTGVSATTFGALIEKFKAARILSTVPPLKLVQTALRTRLLYAGPIDGTYGPLTRVAIKQYEKRKGWPVTGLPTRTLLEHFQQDRKTVTGHQAMSETSATP